MTHPPCLRLCPAYPGNPRNRIEGESPQLRKGHTVFVASLLAMTPGPTADKSRFAASGAGDFEMFLGPESEGEIVVAFARQFQKLRQHKPHLLDHGGPSVGLDDETRHLIARGDPHARLGVPTGIDGDRTAHDEKIGHRTAPVNPPNVSCAAAATFAVRAGPARTGSDPACPCGSRARPARQGPRP